MDRLHVVVLTCGTPGYETARAIAELAEVSKVTVVESPPLRPKSLWRRARLAYRRLGLIGFLSRLANKIRPSSPSGANPEAAPENLVTVSRFDHQDGLDALWGLAPDLMVVDGTYILAKSVFSIPRLGTINLHCGYLPDYKGSPPAFWEIYEGETTVGVSVHFVTDDLDGGPIIDRRRLPLDPAPSGDPLDYIDRLWREILRPAGIEMLGQAVRAAAKGGLTGVAQSAAEGRLFRFPSHKQVRELRRRVRARRHGKR